MGMSMVMWFLEDERQKLNEENKELDSFLSSTSHDLRTPIASILGLTYLGRIELQEEKARTFMNIIEERIKKLDLDNQRYFEFIAKQKDRCQNRRTRP